MSEGWIKLYRKFTEWEWSTKPETSHLFIHILLSANHKDGKWRGITVPAGSYLTGRKALALKTGLTERQIRTALSHLKSTNEVTIQSTNEYSIISITNWNLYQASDQPNANERPAIDQQPTTNKNDNNDKNVKKEYIPPEGVSISVWNDFVKLRKAKKAPVTETVIKGIQREADIIGWTLEDCLKECCTRGWQSFKAEWVLKNEPQKNKLVTQAKELLENGW